MLLDFSVYHELLFIESHMYENQRRNGCFEDRVFWYCVYETMVLRTWCRNTMVDSCIRTWYFGLHVVGNLISLYGIIQQLNQQWPLLFVTQCNVEAIEVKDLEK